MEKNEPINTSYSKKEWWIDSTTFLASSALTCAAKGIVLLDPAAIGLLLSSGANTAAIQASSTFAQKYGIDSRLIQVCALISALALSTLALPWILSVASLQTLAVLSFETAIESTLVHLAFKTAAYSAFHVGLYIKDSFTVTLPTSLTNVQRMSTTELQKIRNHLVDFPKKGRYIPLPVHQELHARLKEADLKNPPLTDFSEIGEGWSDRDLDRLHKQDLRALPLYKRAQINELFFARDFPPQQRPYERSELPELDSQATLKLTTSSKVSWAHLILRLNTKTEIPDGLPKLFYKYRLPPAFDEWISLKSPPSQITALEDYEVGWYQNFYAKNSEDWKALSPDVQTALKARFKTPSRFFSPPTTPLQGRISKKLPWNYIVTGVAIGALGIAAYYAFSSSPIQPQQLTVSTDLVPFNPPSLLDKLPKSIPPLKQSAEKILESTSSYTSTSATWSVATTMTALTVFSVALKFMRCHRKGDRETQLKKLLLEELKKTFKKGVCLRTTERASDLEEKPAAQKPIHIPIQGLGVDGLYFLPNFSSALHVVSRNTATYLRKEISKIASSNSQLSNRNVYSWVKFHFGNQTIKIDLAHPNLRENLQSYLKQLQKEVKKFPTNVITIELHDKSYEMEGPQFLKSTEQIEQQLLENRTVQVIEGADKAKNLFLQPREPLLQSQRNPMVGPIVQTRQENPRVPEAQIQSVEPTIGKQSFQIDLSHSDIQTHYLNFFSQEIQKSPTDLITLRINGKLFRLSRDKFLLQLNTRERLKAESKAPKINKLSLDGTMSRSLVNQIIKFVPADKMLPPDTKNLDFRYLIFYFENALESSQILQEVELAESIRQYISDIQPPSNMTPPSYRKVQKPKRKKRKFDVDADQKYLAQIKDLLLEKNTDDTRLFHPRRFNSLEDLKERYKSKTHRVKIDHQY